MSDEEIERCIPQLYDPFLAPTVPLPVLYQRFRVHEDAYDTNCDNLPEKIKQELHKTLLQGLTHILCEIAARKNINLQVTAHTRKDFVKKGKEMLDERKEWNRTHPQPQTDTEQDISKDDLNKVFNKLNNQYKKTKQYDKLYPRIAMLLLVFLLPEITCKIDSKRDLNSQRIKDIYNNLHKHNPR